MYRANVSKSKVYPVSFLQAVVLNSLFYEPTFQIYIPFLIAMVIVD